jgi:hypothetical protein
MTRARIRLLGRLRGRAALYRQVSWRSTMAERARARVEARCETWGRYVARRPVPVLMVSAALALAFAAGSLGVFDLAFLERLLTLFGARAKAP